MPRPSRSVLIASVIAVIALTIFAGVVLARSSDKLRSGQIVTIPADETVANDLYVFAGSVRVEGTVDGDLVAFGGSIDVPGTVTGDVLAAGGRVTVSGTMGGDVRVAGGSLSIGGKVAEDLAAAGGQVSLDPSGTVGEDMLVSAGRLTVDGAVTGDLMGTAGSYSKAGTVGGTENVVISPERAPTPAPIPPTAEQTATNLLADAIQHFLVVLLAGGLLLWLAPRAYAATEETLRSRPLPSAGWGLLGLVGYALALIAIIIAMVVLAIIFGSAGFGDLVGLSVIGGIVALLGVTLGFIVVCAYLADAIVGAALARLLIRGRGPMTRAQEFGALAAGAAVVVILSSIPIIGGWVKLVVILLGLGAVLLAWWSARPRQPRQVYVPPQPPAPSSPTAA